MRRSTAKILTTHVGALPGPLDTWEGRAGDDALRVAVRDVVAAQRAAGTDVINEGELTKGGSWVTFINSRLSGFTGIPAEGTIALLRSSADWKEFDDFYAKAMAGGTLFEQTASAPVQTGWIRDWVCREPIRYTGQASLKREIELLKSALGSHAVQDAFLTSTAPASVQVGRRNEHYARRRIGILNHPLRRPPWRVTSLLSKPPSDRDAESSSRSLRGALAAYRLYRSGALASPRAASPAARAPYTSPPDDRITITTPVAVRVLQATPSTPPPRPAPAGA